MTKNKGEIIVLKPWNHANESTSHCPPNYNQGATLYCDQLIFRRERLLPFLIFEILFGEDKCFAFHRIYIHRIQYFQEACCWSCVACREDSYVFNDTCRSCGPGYAPDETMTRCRKLTAEVIPWTSPWALVPLVFASIGILSTLFTAVVFIRYVYKFAYKSPKYIISFN